MPLKLSNIVKYSTEGAPMLVGDVASSQHWRGRNHDENGIVVEYGGRGVDKLPKEFAQTKKPTGKRQKAFTELAAAEAFEDALLQQFKRLHPKAAKHPQYPGHPMYYVDGVGVFGIERQFTSALAGVLKKLKGDVSSITFDKKNKAQSLFYDMEGAGPGLIAMDTNSSALVVAKVVTADKEDDKSLIAALERTDLKKVKPLGQVKVGDALVAFESGHDASALAEQNWGISSLADGIQRGLKSSAHGALKVPDQRPAVGAFFRIKPGSYNYGVIRGERAGGVTYNALWLWPK